MKGYTNGGTGGNPFDFRIINGQGNPPQTALKNTIYLKTLQPVNKWSINKTQPKGLTMTTWLRLNSVNPGASFDIEKDSQEHFIIPLDQASVQDNGQWSVIDGYLYDGIKWIQFSPPIPGGGGDIPGGGGDIPGGGGDIPGNEYILANSEGFVIQPSMTQGIRIDGSSVINFPPNGVITWDIPTSKNYTELYINATFSCRLLMGTFEIRNNTDVLDSIPVKGAYQNGTAVKIGKKFTLKNKQNINIKFTYPNAQFTDAGLLSIIKISLR